MKRLILLALLLATPVYAQAPEVAVADTKLVVQIAALDAVVANDLVIFDSAGSNALLLKWDGPKKNFLAIDGGKRAVWAAAPGTWKFTLAGSDADEIDIVSVEIVVSGPGPQPIPPGPTPVPVPVPTKTLADLVDGWADAVSGTNKDERDRLANSFESVAAQIAAGVLKDPDAVIAATKASNGAALATRLASWASFSAELGKHLNALAAKGELDHAVLWREIAEGLRK